MSGDVIGETFRQVQVMREVERKVLFLVVRGLIKGPVGTFRLVVKRDEP